MNTKTKRNFHFIHNLSHSSNESPQKSSLSIPSQKAQKHISQNTSTFEFKRTCVSGKTYLCFSSNASTFSGAYLLGKFMPGLCSSSIAFFMLSFSVLITWKYSFMSQMSRASRAFSCVLISGSAVRNWASL